MKDEDWLKGLCVPEELIVLVLGDIETIPGNSIVSRVAQVAQDFLSEKKIEGHVLVMSVLDEESELKKAISMAHVVIIGGFATNQMAIGHLIQWGSAEDFSTLKRVIVITEESLESNWYDLTNKGLGVLMTKSFGEIEIKRAFQFTVFLVLMQIGFEKEKTEEQIDN